MTVYMQHVLNRMLCEVQLGKEFSSAVHITNCVRVESLYIVANYQTRTMSTPQGSQQ